METVLETLLSEAVSDFPASTDLYCMVPERERARKIWNGTGL